MTRFRSTLALASVLALVACGSGDAPRDDAAGAARGAGPGHSPAEQTYAPQLGVDLAQMEQTPTGLYVQDVQPGTGDEAAPGDLVRVHYTGWLPDGREFDSSRGGQPFEFSLGRGEVIPGWDEGVAGMREGGQRRLVIPSEQAYGERGAGGVIPPNATLVFDVELLEVVR
jgi:FKBP-type peptidyl-prolyl cis-trans isomerase FkpA